MMELQEVSKRISVKDVFAYMNGKKNITRLLSLGFGIVLISWLLSQLELSSAIEIIREVPLSLLIVGFFCYALGFYLRALRFKLLLPPEKPRKHLFPIVLVHYTALNIIPARLGEFSYIYLLKKVNNVSTGCSLSSLILARVFDYMTLSLLFLFSSLFLNLSSQWLKILNLGVSGFLFVTFAILMFLIAFKEKCVSWFMLCIQKFHLERYVIILKIMHEIEEFMRTFRNIQIKEQAGKVFGLSVLIWISIFGENYFLLRAFQVDLNYKEVIFSSTCVILLRFLSFQVVSGFGIHETTWVFIALALGIPKSIAITAAFGSHVGSTIFLFIFGVYGFWKLRKPLMYPGKQESLSEESR